MKVEISKFVSALDGKINTIIFNRTKYKLDKPIMTNIGYTYYIFRTEEKAWIRHSGKLTKEEKQWVIKHEQK